MRITCRTLTLCAAALVAASAVAADRQNIIVILADDLGYGDIGAFGQTRFATPGLDRMAAEGMRLTQFYAGSTVCAPSRGALLTGLHTGHSRIRGNGTISGEPVRLYPEDVTVASLLRTAGYRTACIGKWGCGEEGSTGIPTLQGFDYFYGILNQRRAHFYYPEWIWRNTDQVEIEGNDPETQTGKFVHTLFTDEALRYVRENAGTPLFLYMTYTIPHAELVAPADEIAEFAGRFDPERAFAKAHYNAQPTPRAAFAAMVTMLDRDVGRLLDLLTELGIAEDTLVIFSSDNGPHKEGGHDYEYFDSNGPLRGTKRDLYEGGIRVPTLAWWPGTISAGTTSDHVAASWDILATCTELAGVTTPENIDGISFLPTLRGEPERQREHEYLYWEFYEEGGKTAVRWGNWKGVRRNLFVDPNSPLELYDLPEDISESIDVADRHPETVAHILDIMRGAHTPSPDYSFER